MKKSHSNLLMPLALLMIYACNDTAAPPYQRVLLEEGRYALTAYCEMNFTDRGIVAIESEYLPRVIACENGAAGMEALKAQAVAARSYLYYQLHHNGSIGDGQSDQVFTCNNQPGPQHYEAVNVTSGEVLSYREEVIAAFYVAGAIPSTGSCQALDSDPDRSNTERYVTYNLGLSGDDLIQTTLGWADPGNIYNRGCKSQNGAHCLSQNGTDYRDILRFYYGVDITLEKATGVCVLNSSEGGSEVPAGSEAPAGTEVTSGVDSPGDFTIPAGYEATAGSKVSAGIEAQSNSDTQSEVEMNAGFDTLGGSDRPFVMNQPQRSCSLGEGQVAYGTVSSCAWQSCDAVNDWETYMSGYRVTCEASPRCELGWLLKVEQSARYRFGLQVPDWIEPGLVISYHLQIGNRSYGVNLVSLIPGTINQLFEESLRAGQEVELTFYNQCQGSDLGLEKIYVRALDGSGTTGFIGNLTEANGKKESGGVGCQHVDHSARLSLYILVILFLLRKVSMHTHQRTMIKS